MSNGFVHKAGAGKTYHWGMDNPCVKISGADTNGQFDYIEDTMKPGFELGTHYHKEHYETFYVLEGELIFTVEGEEIVATPGDCLHVPPMVKHSLKTVSGGKSLMIYQPSGFAALLEVFATMSAEDGNDPEKMRQINEAHDIWND